MNTTRREFLKMSATAAVVASLPLTMLTNQEMTVRWTSQYDLSRDQQVVHGTVGTNTKKWNVAVQCKVGEEDQVKDMMQETLYEHLNRAGVNVNDLIELPAVIGA